MTYYKQGKKTFASHLQAIHAFEYYIYERKYPIGKYEYTNFPQLM